MKAYAIIAAFVAVLIFSPVGLGATMAQDAPVSTCSGNDVGALLDGEPVCAVSSSEDLDKCEDEGTPEGIVVRMSDGGVSCATGFASVTARDGSPFEMPEAEVANVDDNDADIGFGAPPTIDDGLAGLTCPAGQTLVTEDKRGNPFPEPQCEGETVCEWELIEAGLPPNAIRVKRDEDGCRMTYSLMN